MKSMRYLVSCLPLIGVVACGAAAETESTATAQSALTNASVELLAIGNLTGASDRSRETAGNLENGDAGNILGGLGSGIAFAGGNTFLALPDRGPNAVPYDGSVDDTTSYVNRFQSLHLKLRHAAKGSSLPFELNARLVDTTLLYSETPLVYGPGDGSALRSGAPSINRRRHYYFAGRSDDFDPSAISTNAQNGRLDPEGIRVSNDGRRVYISDEYGPYVYEFDRASGRRQRAFTLPDEFAVTKLNAKGDNEIAGNLTGRVANKGMEGLAITPDGQTLVGAMQSPLLQDGGTSGRFVRLVTISIETGEVAQYAYELTNTGTASKPKYPTVSEIVAVNDHEFLVDERDGKGLGDNSTAAYKKLYHIDLTGAPEVSGISGEANLAGLAVPKSLFLDVVAALNAQGIASTDIPAKLEGLAFGSDVWLNGSRLHTLFVSNDNDFLSRIVDSNHPDGIENPNQFFVFGIGGDVLPGFQAQAGDCQD